MIQDSDIARALQIKFENSFALYGCPVPSLVDFTISVKALKSVPNAKIFLDGKTNGFIFGAIIPHHLIYTLKQATILVSWFTEETRGLYSIKLVKKFFDWAKENQADCIMLDDFMCNPDVGKIYEKWGMHRLETHYFKMFKGE